MVRYNMILGRDQLTELGLDLKFSSHVIEADDRTLKGSTSPMVDLSAYLFKDSNIGEIKTEYFFTDTYVEEVCDSEHVRTTT